MSPTDNLSEKERQRRTVQRQVQKLIDVGRSNQAVRNALAREIALRVVGIVLMAGVIAWAAVRAVQTVFPPTPQEERVAEKH